MTQIARRLIGWWLLAALAAQGALAGPGEWKTFTAKRDVRAVARAGSVVWAATSGGLFAYDGARGTYAEFTTSEGLKTIDLTAVAADDAGNVWIGAANGVLHRYEPSTGQWRTVMDIAILDNPQKRINALRVVDDTLFILSEVGLSRYQVSRGEFGDTYARFGAAPTQAAGGVTAMAVQGGLLWVGTHLGVASTPLTNPNPSAPDSWRLYRTADGLPSVQISALVVEPGGALCAATAGGLAVFTGSAWVPLPSTAGRNVVGMTAGPAGLIAATASELFTYAVAESALTIVSGAFPSPVTCLADAGLLGTRRSGALLGGGASWTAHAPAGPASNKFISLAMGADGVLWAGTGATNGEGAMRYDGTTWRSYTVENTPALGQNDVHKVSLGAANAAWLSTWGSGTTLVGADGNVRRSFRTSNGLPPTLLSDTSFVVVNGVATDRDGVAWITNRTAGDSTAVVRFLPDSTLDKSVRFRMRDPDIAFTDLVIDGNNTKWFANYSRFENASKPGLLWYNAALALSGFGRGWGRLTAADGLTSDAVWCVALDRQGEVWVGSDQGISILFDPLYPRQRLAVYHPLRDQIIQAIAVDALNNKWVGTKQGVALLSPDGTTILAQYTAASTDGKLLDDDVNAIAVDNATGTVYFGTEKGLSSLTTPAVTPVRSFDALTASPNPYLLPSPIPLTVDGLVENATLKVLAIDGTLVREIVTPGGRVGYWDGRDARGNLAASGIYLVVAYSEDGSKVATGKVAVIRR